MADTWNDLPVIDPEKVRDHVHNSLHWYMRAHRFETALATPVRERSAKQAALIAVGRLIDKGVFL